MMPSDCHPAFLSDRALIAYAGGRGDGFENDLPTIRRSADLARDVILEIDIRCTRDGVPVAFHDASMDRVSDRSGAIEHHTWQQLQTVRLQSGNAIPALDAILEAIPNPVLLDVRVSDDAHLERLVRLIEPIQHRVALVSESEPTLAALLSSAPNACHGASRRRAWGCFLGLPSARASIWMIPPRFGPLDLVGAFGKRCRPEERIWVWTVDDPEQARALHRRGVHGVFTPTPSRLVDWATSSP